MKPQLTERLLQAVAKLSPQRKKMLDKLLSEWERLDYREDSRIPCFLPVDFSTKDRVYQDFIQQFKQRWSVHRDLVAISCGSIAFAHL
jgi:hypothetical protein